MKLMHTKKLTIVLMVIFFSLTALLVFLNVKENKIDELIKKPEEKKTFQFFRNIDGVGVDDETLINVRPIAVILDNAADARPAIGLGSASLVYETIAEGSITRLLAIFDPTQIPQMIGPIRSLRPYFLSWISEVDAVAVHVGGSPQALREVRLQDNINEFTNGTFFWRNENRLAPHNVFSSEFMLSDAVQELGYATTTTLIPWSYATHTPEMLEKQTAHITIDFSLDLYKVAWSYDVDNNAYQRFIDNKAEDIRSSNIIVMVVPARVIDNELRRELSIIGKGKAWIFNNGQHITGQWKKENYEERTVFTDMNGDTIKFSPGMTWIEVIDEGTRLSFF